MADTESISKLAESIRRERLQRAMQMPESRKILDGARLFEYACRMTLAGIRHQNPGISDEEAHRILRERVNRQRERESAG